MEALIQEDFLVNGNDPLHVYLATHLNRPAMVRYALHKSLDDMEADYTRRSLGDAPYSASHSVSETMASEESTLALVGIATISYILCDHITGSRGGVYTSDLIVSIFSEASQWDKFWRWARLTIETCILTGEYENGAVSFIERCFYRFIHGKPFPIEILKRQPDITLVFARLWLHGVERGTLTFLLTKLMSANVGDPDDVFKELGGRHREVAELVLGRIDILPTFLTRFDVVPYSLLDIVWIIFHLEATQDYMTQAFVGCGMARTLLKGLKFMWACRVRNLQEPNPCGFVECIDKGLVLILICLKEAPCFVVEALDFQILPMIVALSGLFRSSLYSATEIAPIGEKITDVLETLRSSMFCYYVQRSMEKALKRIVDVEVGLKPAEVANAPYSSAWNSLLDTAKAGALMRAEFIASKRHPCQNPHCPRKALPHRNFRVKTCGSCKVFDVCSVRCQRATWEIHRHVCSGKSSRVLTEYLTPSWCTPSPREHAYYHFVMQSYLRKKEFSDQIDAIQEDARNDPTRPTQVIGFDFRRTTDEPIELLVNPLSEYVSEDGPELVDLDQAMKIYEEAGHPLVCGFFPFGQDWFGLMCNYIREEKIADSAI